MTKTLTGVPEWIQHNFENYTKPEFGTTYKHKVRFLDGTKAQVHTKKNELENFKLGEECQYHVLEHLKDGVKKIKYGEPWKGGSSSQPQATGIDPNKDELILRQVCIKAAAAAVNGGTKHWQPTAEEMYKWVIGDTRTLLEWAGDPPKEEDDDLPF